MEPPEQLSMPATASNKQVLEDYYEARTFNTCKRQHWPITAGGSNEILTQEDAPRIYCIRPTKVPVHFRDEVGLVLRLMSRREY